MMSRLRKFDGSILDVGHMCALSYIMYGGCSWDHANPNAVDSVSW